jgi:predicted component of type VI protein secretion system
LQTDVNKSLGFALNLLKRKSIVIIISDFIDFGYEHNLTAMAQKHDLVVIHLSDSREVEFPKLGIIPLYDKESRRTIWVNSSSKKFREKMKKSFAESNKNLEQTCRKHKANYLWIDTREEYVTKLIKLFRIRNQTRKSA